AMIGHQRQRQERTRPAIILGVDEVAHGGPSGLGQKARPVCSHPKQGHAMKPARPLLFLATSLSAGALVAPASAAPNDPGRAKVAAQIHANHEQSVQRLRDWIKLPTIANMGINHKEGAEYMRQQALD